MQARLQLQQLAGKPAGEYKPKSAGRLNLVDALVLKEQELRSLTKR